MNRGLIAAGLCGVLLSGCSHMGPSTVPRDRFDYNTAVSDSWKEQTLLNIVKLRYADMPMFMEVASIVSGYSLESSVNVAGSVFESGAAVPNVLTLGGAGKYTDRPTITYAPITGSQFNRNFMTPVPPAAVLFLIQSGWPADMVLPISVEAMNGLRAQKSAGMRARTGDRDYYRAIELFRQVQGSGAIGMRVLKEEGLKETTVMVIRRGDIAPEVTAAQRELATLLGLKGGLTEYTVAYGEVARKDTELAMLTRSILSIMVELASQIDVPQQHIDDGWTLPSLIQTNGIDKDDIRRLITVHHGLQKPEHASTAVKYKDYWYWIDEGDFKSKRTFAYLMILFSLTESGGREGLPLVTIPAG